MTFEEFLIRKKIDAIQLKAKEPTFFSEFESHFQQMGEKSFDHSKKFLFNKLRRAYHLKEEPKPVKEEAKIDEIPAIAKEKSGIEPINQEKPAYVPRFKAVVKIPEEIEETSQIKKVESEEIAKPVYKPRFRAQTPAPEEKQPEVAAESIPKSEETAKPAYRPRFNPGLTKKNPETE